MNVLIRMFASSHDRRGLGDTVQFNIVIKHIKKHNPNWKLFLETTQGKEPCCSHLVERCFLVEERCETKAKFDKIINFNFKEPDQTTCDRAIQYSLPASKPLDAVVGDLELTPDPNLFKYEIEIKQQTKKIVSNYLKTIPQKNGIVSIHYQASSSPNKKNIAQNDVKNICDFLFRNGYTPLILDWKDDTLIDNQTIFGTTKNHSIWQNQRNGSAEIIAAIIEQSKLFIGVDSGPLHIAGCLKTPTIGFWKDHHPMHYFDFSDNVIHLLPKNSWKNFRGRNRNELNELFEKLYNYKYYHNFNDDIFQVIQESLSLEPECLNTARKEFHFSPIKSGQFMTFDINLDRLSQKR